VLVEKILLIFFVIMKNLHLRLLLISNEWEKIPRREPKEKKKKKNTKSKQASKKKYISTCSW
jgi:hypothetical protein